jgi:acyl-[acyl-carrier-protein]-phospholipid O-acyltransferase/long-chain-fatty-acid--[acyl-carrier-protein] ligase
VKPKDEPQNPYQSPAVECRAAENALPPNLVRDAAFWGLVCTQFLGAFNDNVYKTTLMLLFVAVPTGQGAQTQDWQGLGTFLFALPFLLFSGWAGYLSDRYRKWTVIASCKFAELAIMLLGLGLFYVYQSGPMDANWLALFCVVLFLMGSHSAFFGPGKYGILPELFREEQIPTANGMILMTTFLAIIFGQGLAGWLKDTFRDDLLPIGGVCCGLALLGIVTSFWIRPSPAKDAQLRFHWDMLLIPREILNLLRSDSTLHGAVWSSSLFWLAAGMVQQIVVAFGKLQLEIGNFQSTLLLGAVSVGIILGAPLAGYLSQGRFHTGVMKSGAWGIAVCLFALALPGGAKGQWLGYSGSLACLVLLGVFAGLLSVPLQVFMQMRPPSELKGRMIATMNLANFIGILLAGPLYWITSLSLERVGGCPSLGFVVPAGIMLAVSIGYRPHPTAALPATENQ